ncbi:MAG: glycoside hydrolase family 37 [Rikenellaceae bacterium]|jgi:putative isomerase|nr:glycoside hydrolase family 37 [Rikenellaceae bacterium]
MKKLLPALFLFCWLPAAAQLPERTPANVEKYMKICRDHIHKEMKGMYREPGGALRYPFLAPGSSQYLDMLWDWDSWLSNVALRQNLLENGTDKDRAEALEYERGCVLNALSYGAMDGWIPIWIERNAPSREEMLKTRNPWKSNMHKPTIAQHAAFIVEQSGGDVEWLREPFYYLQTFVDNYLNHHRHRATGLMYWETDEAIGVDTDPSTYYRPDASSGSIYLNALMYKELLAMAHLAEKLDLPDIAGTYDQAAEELLAAIREHCWDPRDGFYYSVDLNLRPIVKPDATGVNPGDLFLHVGKQRTYDCLIQRLDVWSGFLAMWAGIATPEQAELIVDRHYRDETRFNAPAGIRTLSPLEKMYDTRASGNPSSWNGPVWICVNYLVFRGLADYGYDAEARELAEKTVLLLGRDFERFGALHEYYLPDNGEPVLNKGFQNWNLLVLNMAAWLKGKEYVTEF